MGADLEREFKVLSSRLPFGLNFERHRPEAVELPQRPVRKGDKVRILPERGSTKKGDLQLWVVKKIEKSGKRKLAELEPIDAESGKSQKVSLDDIVVVAEFRDTIYPGLISTGQVARGSKKPFHTVINGENYHVIKALTWTHRGKIDAIYIDPPYNTRDKDWKYNNDYVNADDMYRHSKWLAMMERRLLIARQLLNPDDSVLVVTIDEKEYLRLGLLLEQLFPESRIQMVTTLTNPKGVARGQEFYRVEEYIFFVFLGNASVKKCHDPMILTGKRNDKPDEKSKTKKIRWGNLLRSGTDAKRTDRKHQFYPIFLDSKSGKLHSIGEPLLPVTADKNKITPPHGTLAVWPIRKDGSEGRWQVGNKRLKELFDKGHASIGRFNGTNKVSFSYVTDNLFDQIESGEIIITGRDHNGVVTLTFSDDATTTENPKTMWNKTSHSASEYGTTLLRSMIPGRDFPFPKSLYAVEDTLRFIVADKPAAIILDFFSGSGTTAHAVMRLNRQDGGIRQCISVTNNEVAADEQQTLRENNLRLGDSKWEKHGICDFITKPRVEAAITGKTPDGKPIKGDYKFTDEFPMAEGFGENAEFFTLTYETPVSVSHHMAFARIAPLLWLRAGSQGRRIDKLPAKGWEVVDTYGVLIDLDCSTDFLKATGKAKGLQVVYIVTDDERRFQALARRLPDGVEAVRLYESYLTNFAFANGD